MWLQREVTLEARPRGFHLVTRELVEAVPELRDVRVGMAHVFIRHTSASLTLNENASPAVRRDFRSWFDEAVPFTHAAWRGRMRRSFDRYNELANGVLRTLPVDMPEIDLGRIRAIPMAPRRVVTPPAPNPPRDAPRST